MKPLLQDANHPLFGVEGTGTVFLEPDAKLAAWLADQLAPEEILVDCGAGVGALGALVELADKVCSIDLTIPPEDKARSPVYLMDATTFPWAKGKIPIFCRPCRGFVDYVVEQALPVTGRAYYIGKESNLPLDFDLEAVRLHKVAYFDWTGPAGEQIWLVTLPTKKTSQGIHEMVLNNGYWVRVEYNQRYDEVQYRNERGGYSPRRHGLPEDITRHLLVIGYPEDGFDVVDAPRWRRLTKGYAEDQAARAVILQQLGADPAWFKLKAGERVIEVPEAIMRRWSAELSCSMFDPDYGERMKALDAVWKPVSISGVKQMNDSATHTDLMYAMKIDGEPLHDIFCWSRQDFQPVRSAIEDLRFMVNYPDCARGSWACTPLANADGRIVRGIVARPKPGETVAAGSIAVLPNGTPAFDAAAHGAAALILGAGGAVCHMVTEYRSRDLLIVRFDRWAALHEGEEVEIDSRIGLVTLIPKEADRW